MSAAFTSFMIAASLCGAVLLGMLFRRILPDHHLSSDTKDTVKVAMGLVATMSALLLGLLVSSSKSSYDTVRSEVIQISAKVTFLDRLLGLYGPEADPLRARLRTALHETIPQIWTPAGSAILSNTQMGDAVFAAVQSLSPQDDPHRTLKEQAFDQAVDIGQLRTLLQAQSMASISAPLLVVVVCWLGIIFFSFSLFSPSNATASISLLIAALSVAGAIFLILEMDTPFTGLIKVSSEPMSSAFGQFPK